MIRLLVVDDSALVRKLLGEVFRGEPDFAVGYARSGAEALALLAEFQPDVITLDVHMPHMDGLACLDRIMVERPCAVVMVSGLTRAGADATLEAMRLGAVDFVSKPAGAVSLHMEEWGPELVAKVRGAARARIRSSTRLADRLRNRSRLAPAVARERGAEARVEPVVGDGLVLVGTSTGGPPALEALLTALPGNFAWPIVVAQHMPSSFTGALARRLDGICAVRVTEVAGPVPLEAGTVYIGRGDADVIVSRRAAGLIAMSAPALAGYPWHPSTDRLVRSAMEHVEPHRLVGVLMTGMGNDGAAAMTELRRGGGRTIAEAEETAVVWGMPGELAKAGGAEFILPLPRIGGCLQALVPATCP